VRYPAWKRAYAVKAAKLRKRCTAKAIAERIGVTQRVIEYWTRPEARK
jgi:hypothetical protein